MSVKFSSKDGESVKQRAEAIIKQMVAIELEIEARKEHIEAEIRAKYPQEEIDQQIEEKYQELVKTNYDATANSIYRNQYARLVQDLLDETIEALEAPEPQFIINDPIPPELSWYGFKNGVYNWKTKELITKPDRLINCFLYRDLELPEQLPTETPLLDWMISVFYPNVQHSISKEDFRKMIILLATGKWAETGRVGHMGGEPGTGKTTLMLMICAAISGNVLELSGTAFERWLTDKNSQYKAIGKILVWFDEPKKTREFPEEIKAVTGIRGDKILRKRWVEDKYVASSEVWTHYGFMLTYNTIPYTSVAAIEAMEPWRRGYIIEWKKQTDHVENPNLLTDFEKMGGGDQLFLECLSLLTPELLESLYVLPKDVVAKMDEILCDQISPLRDMIDECCEPCDDSMITHPAMNDLIKWYYCHVCGMDDLKYVPNSNDSTNKIYLHMKSLGYPVPSKERKNKRPYDSTGVRHRGIWGLKVKAEYWQKIQQGSRASDFKIEQTKQGESIYHAIRD